MKEPAWQKGDSVKEHPAVKETFKVRQMQTVELAAVANGAKFEARVTKHHENLTITHRGLEVKLLGSQIGNLRKFLDAMTEAQNRD